MAVKLNNKGELLSATGYAAVVNGVVRFDSAANSPEAASTLAHGENVQVVRVTVKPYTKRSLDANALLHVWSDQIAEFCGTSKPEQKNIIKIDFGLPILRRNQAIWSSLGWMLERCYFDTRMTREQQLKFIDPINVTSLMDKDEFKQLLNDVQQFAASDLGLSLYSTNDFN